MLLTWLAYAPGLKGGFLFDDFANLPTLGDNGPIDNWPTFWRYITSGIADPAGRPLTLLSFLMDARDWPADPYAFKRTNLVLHLLNGALLYALLSRLGRSLDLESRRSHLAALIGAALWLLHPLLVSTTLYIVQREAMLPATCALVGLLIWLHGRSQLAVGKKTSGLSWCALGLGAFTLLGILAKANGVLLPLYALLIESLLLAPRVPLSSNTIKRAYRAFMASFAVLPTAIVVITLVWIGVNGILTGGPASRPWTYAQRLLTEPRVLIDYLQLLWLPRSFSSGLFNDQYMVSNSLWNPVSTLPSIIAVLGLLAVAYRVRQRFPALALAILFYFVGQIIESSSIPLELYFEHRNYAPALLMFWPLGLWLSDLRTLTVLKRMMIILLPIGLGVLTYVRADVWGNVAEQAIIWARINPESPRAQANAAQIEMQSGRPEGAIPRLETLLRAKPNQLQLAINLIGARCMMGKVDLSEIALAKEAMLTTPSNGTLLPHWFNQILPVATTGGCVGLTPAVLRDLIDAGLDNPNLKEPGPKQDLTYLRGRIALAQHQRNTALVNFIAALDLQIRPDVALSAAASLGENGYPRQGLALLNHYQQEQNKVAPPAFGMPVLHAWVLRHQNYWPNEIDHLRNQLTLDAHKSGTNTAASPAQLENP